ncbi:MAG: autotransporter assembly complex protein TamA [Betaproteobacteria bacterium]
MYTTHHHSCRDIGVSTASGWRRMLAAGGLWLLVLASPAHAYMVEIEGAGALTSLLDEYLEIRRHRTDPAVSKDELQRLVGMTPQQIRELLATRGYFSPAVRSELLPQGDDSVARFVVELGPLTRIATVDIRFAGAIAEGEQANPRRMERLRSQWSLTPGEPFRQADWDEAKRNLLKNLLVRDFPAAAITRSEALVDPERHAAALTVEVDSGPAFTFGQLEIHGLERYSRRAVEALNPIQPGERYSQEKLNELQSRAQDTGYFAAVFASAEIDPAHPDRVPVRLDLTENKRKRLSFGVGFSTDTGAMLQSKWLDRNFLGRDWRLESELKFDRKTQLLSGDIHLPALQNGWIPSFNARYSRTDIAEEVNNTIRTGARLTSPNKADENIWAVDYLADRQALPGSEINYRRALIGSYTHTRRRLDNLITPRRGYVASIELSAGPPGVINEKAFTRLLAQATWLSPIRNHWQAVLRGQVGNVFGAGRETVPGELLFRTGGAQSVRGYGFNDLGVSQNGAIVGGKVLAVVSAEVVYHITPAWGAAVFHDAGNAADGWGGFKFKHGTGVGARWRSPVGPVNVDLAYGHATHKPQLHFSIGYVF